MTVTTISLPDELYRRLKLAALNYRHPAVELVRNAISEYLDRLEKAERVGRVPILRIPKTGKETIR